MATIRQIVDELRRRGVTVHEWPGWDGRGNSDGGTGPAVPYIDAVGAVIHHTATPYGSAYAGLASSTRPDLFGGAVCNFAGNDDGSLTVIASGLAWHAGPGVGPNLGPVLGAVPGIRLKMNRLTAGLEIIYPGDQPMRPAQYSTATIFGSVVADLSPSRDIECVRAHFETNGAAPGGSYKWDPGFASGKSIDMAAFRRDAGAVPTVLEDDMPQAVTTHIPTGEEVVFAFPPAGPGAAGGAAGWGRAWFTVLGDRFGHDGGDIHARIAIRGSGGSWRPAFGTGLTVTLPVGRSMGIQLNPGDNAAVFSETDGDIGVCVEYAKA